MVDHLLCPDIENNFEVIDDGLPLVSLLPGKNSKKIGFHVKTIGNFDI
jgi:hypothetical protein